MHNDRPLPFLPAYGTHIQDLLHYILTIKNKETRTQYTHQLISLIQKIQTSGKNKFANTAKIWHDLYIMSDYQLDVESPYPKPKKTVLSPPQPMRYSHQKELPYTQYYGYNIANYIIKIAELQDKELQQKLLIRIIKLMTRYYKKREYISMFLDHIKKIVDVKIVDHFKSLLTTIKI